MEVMEFLKEKNRMCDEFHCPDCPLYGANNGTGKMCTSLKKQYPEKYVSIVEKWSKEHPAKTKNIAIVNI